MATGKAQIVNREGAVRKQGDYSSWNNSPSSSSPSSSPSRDQTTGDKVRDSIQYDPGLPSWAANPDTQENIDKSNVQQFKTVDQIEKAQSSNPKSSIIKAAKEGYKAGKGQEYSLEGLQSPEIDYSGLKTKGIYEKAQGIAGKIDTYQNRALSHIPGSGLGKDIITGVTNIPEIAIQTGGAIPLGLESIARNRKSSLDSISFGLGATIGGFEQKARDNPGELAGELAGGYLLGKGYSKFEAKVKPGFSSEGLKDFALSERASLGGGRTQRLNEGNPLRQASRQKQQMLYKEKPVTIQEVKVPTYVYKHGRLYPEGQLPKMGGAVDIMKLENSAITGVSTRASARGRASVKGRTSRGGRSNKVLQEETVSLPKEETIPILKQKQEAQLFPKEPTVIKQKQSMQIDNIYSLKTKQDIISIPKIESISIPKTESILSPTIRGLPAIAAGLKEYGGSKYSPALSLFEVPAISQKNNPVSIPGLSPATSQKQYTPSILDIKIDSITDTAPAIIPGIPSISPVNPFSPEPKGRDIFPDFSIFRPSKTLPILTVPELDLSGSREEKTKKRKTKQKMTKNKYGDIRDII